VITDTFTDLPPSWRRLLLFVFGAACTVVVLAGVRAVAGLLNPVLLRAVQPPRGPSPNEARRGRGGPCRRDGPGHVE